MSDFWGQLPPPNNQQPWGQQPDNQQPWSQQPPQSPTQHPWGQPIPQQSKNQHPWGQSSLPNQQPQPTQQAWGQQPSNTNWQQQPLYSGQFQPVQTPQKKKRNKLWVVLGIVGGVLALSCAFCGIISSFSKTSNAYNTTVTQTTTPIDTSTKVAQAVQPTTIPKPTPTPTLAPTPKPTATPVPTETQAQTEADYKASTVSTTIADLDKDGNADIGKDVHFTCTILKFVKDASGNTAGANVTTQDTSAVVQVEFTTGTDITKLNEEDILEVWGTDAGVFSGTNSFGATVQEVGITAQYMNDQTSNYQVDN